MTPSSVISDLPRLRQVAGHHSTAPFYLTGDMFGGIPVELAAAELTELVGKPLADEHEHTVPEIYVLLAPEPGGAELEVTIGGAVHRMLAPSVCFVPANTPHRFVTKRAVEGSYCLGLLLGNEADEAEHQAEPSTDRHTNSPRERATREETRCS